MATPNIAEREEQSHKRRSGRQRARVKYWRNRVIREEGEDVDRRLHEWKIKETQLLLTERVDFLPHEPLHDWCIRWNVPMGPAKTLLATWSKKPATEGLTNTWILHPMDTRPKMPTKMEVYLQLAECGFCLWRLLLWDLEGGYGDDSVEGRQRGSEVFGRFVGRFLREHAHGDRDASSSSTACPRAPRYQ